MLNGMFVLLWHLSSFKCVFVIEYNTKVLLVLTLQTYLFLLYPLRWHTKDILQKVVEGHSWKWPEDQLHGELRERGQKSLNTFTVSIYTLKLQYSLLLVACIMWATHKQHRNKAIKDIYYYYVILLFFFLTSNKCGLGLHILTQRVTQYHVTNSKMVKRRRREREAKRGRVVGVDDVTASDFSFNKHE